MFGGPEAQFRQASQAPNADIDRDCQVSGCWRTYAIQLELPLTTNEEATAYLRALLPELSSRRKAWAQSR